MKKVGQNGLQMFCLVGFFMNPLILVPDNYKTLNNEGHKVDFMFVYMCIMHIADISGQPFFKE